MNEQNFEYLARQIKFTGFGTEHREELFQRMQSGEPLFTIGHFADFVFDQAEAELHFRKPETGDIYFFNGFLLTVKNDKPEETFTQSFRVGRDFSVTLKEAYNLMRKRAIHKEISPRDGEKYRAWIQLNFEEKDDYGNFKFRMFHENYGYDLRETLAQYPIKELEHVESAQLLVRSLERGNQQSVKMMREGRETRMFIEACPQYKSLNMYDHYLNRFYPTEDLRAGSANHGDEEAHRKQTTRREEESKTLTEPGSETPVPKKIKKQNHTTS